MGRLLRLTLKVSALAVFGLGLAVTPATASGLSIKLSVSPQPTVGQPVVVTSVIGVSRRSAAYSLFAISKRYLRYCPKLEAQAEVLPDSYETTIQPPTDVFPPGATLVSPSSVKGSPGSSGVAWIPKRAGRWNLCGYLVRFDKFDVRALTLKIVTYEVTVAKRPQGRRSSTRVATATGREPHAAPGTA
jgi:hypothetical protein